MRNCSRYWTRIWYFETTPHSRQLQMLRLFAIQMAVAKQAKHFTDRAQSMMSVLVNGSVGVITGYLDQPIFILEFTVGDGKITEIGMIANQARLREFDIAALND
ncbi:hypothetical protein DVH26_19275 [Paenibacillus sp. H1-7]|uniref:hypothetical protein n=1 Tax=Paenibacillus sp. H1-7 TaxID=2282849 RepID=UPI001EF98000|nr:hypothetical protein [Paenibacillus sp. H1-7]ULL16396.1 hypothetical protein DVH26_19275 [Paenibacillus sp. H1-7]